MKLHKLNRHGVTHLLAPMLVVLGVGAIGVYMLTQSHAATAPEFCLDNNNGHGQGPCLNDKGGKLTGSNPLIIEGHGAGSSNEWTFSQVGKVTDTKSKQWPFSIKNYDAIYKGDDIYELHSAINSKWCLADPFANDQAVLQKCSSADYWLHTGTQAMIGVRATDQYSSVEVLAASCLSNGCAVNLYPNGDNVIGNGTQYWSGAL